MTTEQLDHLEQLAAAATPGPWAQCSPKFEEAINTADDKLHIAMVNIGPGLDMPANAAFITAARQAVPELIAEMRKLQRQVAYNGKRAENLAHENKQLKREFDRLLHHGPGSFNA